MNILLLVSAFLILFSLGFYSLFQTYVTAQIEEKGFYTFIKLERQGNNKWQERGYAKALTPPKSKEEKKTAAKESNTDPVSKKKRELDNPRIKPNPWDESKLNLAPLIANPSSAKQGKLYEIAAKLLYELYNQTAVGTLAKELKIENFHYLILDTILDGAKEDPQATSFSEFFPKDPKLEKLYYKMCKGTNNYDTAPGYPPLEEFFLLQGTKSKPISFCFATAPLLKALIGPTLTQLVLDEEKCKSEEKRRFTPMKRNEFEALLSRHPEEKLQLSDIENIVNFSTHKDSPNAYLFIDSSTQLSVKTK